MTSKEINKEIKKLTEQKESLLEIEGKISVFNCSVGEDEDKIRPKYDFLETQKMIDKIDTEVRTLKHQLNIFNSTTKIGDSWGTTIDEALIQIPQLSQRKTTLKSMLNRIDRERVKSGYGDTIVDYEIRNYKTADVQTIYDGVCERLNELQTCLDKVNSTVEVK